MQLVGYGVSSVPLRPSWLPADGPVAAFTISGGVSGLFPGRTMPLKLTVSNQESYTISVVSITTRVGNAKTACTAANVSVTSFSGRLVLGGYDHAQVTVSVTMVKAAPTSCEGAVFPLVYSGVATPAPDLAAASAPVG
jgi:hypothetical protein